MVHQYPTLANSNDPFTNPFDRVTLVENPPKYTLPYQVIFSITNIGKHVSSAKREIKFRFGLANDKALHSGLSGMACCGEEHEIKIVRTVNSGKRSVIVDDDEIHASSSRLDNKFELTWTMCGYRKAKVTINRFPVGPKSRHFDFTLDGVSFFEFPKISELGTNLYDLPSEFAKSSPKLTTPSTVSTHVVNPTSSRFPFFLLRRKGYTTIPPQTRSCPAIKTYKKKKAKEQQIQKSSINATSDNNTCASSGTGYSMNNDDLNYITSPSSNMSNETIDRLTQTESQNEFVEFNKLSGKNVRLKSLPTYAVVC